MNIKKSERICPLCGNDNNCQHGQGGCWCDKIKFTKEILDLIPDDKKGKACICKSCFDKFQSQKEISKNDGGIDMSLKLLRASSEMEEAYYDFINDWEKNDEEIVPYAARLLDMDYKTWLDFTYKIEAADTCPPNLVPAHTYFLVQENKKIIGAVNIRHYLNDYLFNFGGHIGYGIRPSERNNGYASLMLSMALPIAKGLGINRVLVTCNKNNVGSAKTMIKNGGVLENEVAGDGEITQRYWIEV